MEIDNINGNGYGHNHHKKNEAQLVLSLCECNHLSEVLNSFFYYIDDLD